jgi:hypothetical protein
MLLFAYLAAVSSRVGFHKSITPMVYKGSKRFVVDLWILYSYFLLITSAEPIQVGHEHMFRLLAALVFVGIGYVVWDFLKRREYPGIVPTARIVLSLVFLITSIEILGLYWLDSSLKATSLFGYSGRNLLFLLLCSCNLVFYWALKYIAPVEEQDLLARKRNKAVERVLQRFRNLTSTP